MNSSAAEPSAPYVGMLTAMVTPFDTAGAVGIEAAVELGRHLLVTGSDGLVLCATTGEPWAMTPAARIGLFETLVAELSGSGAIVGSTGSNDTREACRLTELAVQAGVDAVLSVTPYYNRPSRGGLIRHFAEVARAAGGRPVILYNNPSRTALNMPPDLLAQLAQIDGIEALKQSNADELQLIDGLAVLAGNDDCLARCLDLGGAGGICVASHIIGKQMKRLFDEPEARSTLDADLRDVYSVMFLTANPAPVKAALTLLGHRVGGVRLPLIDLDDREAAELRKVLSRHRLLQLNV